MCTSVYSSGKEYGVCVFSLDFSKALFVPRLSVTRSVMVYYINSSVDYIDSIVINSGTAITASEQLYCSRFRKEIIIKYNIDDLLLHTGHVF